jgi:transposase
MQKPKQPDRRRYQQQLKPNDLSRCLAPLHSDHTLIAVVELSLSSWLVAGVVPNVERQPLMRLRPEPGALVELLHRWRYEADRLGHKIRHVRVDGE